MNDFDDDLTFSPAADATKRGEAKRALRSLYLLGIERIRARQIIETVMDYISELEFSVSAQSPAFAQDKRSEREKAILECAAAIKEMTVKHADPNGTDYQQGTQDHGHRCYHAVLALSTPASAQPDAEPEAFVWRDGQCIWRGLIVGHSGFFRGTGIRLTWLAVAALADTEKRKLGWFPTQELAQRAVEEAVRGAIGDT